MCAFNTVLAVQAGRPGEEAIELARLVERALKQSHALDMEALCVVAGRKVGGGPCKPHREHLAT